MRRVTIFLAAIGMGILLAASGFAAGQAGPATGADEPVMVAQAEGDTQTAETAPPCEPKKEDPWLTAPEEVLIESPGFENRRRGPVAFSHKDHNMEYGVSCEVCHHFRQEADMAKWACDDCHSAAGKVGKVPGLKTALHSDCKDCHREKQRTGESDIAPYMDCDACHQKKK